VRDVCFVEVSPLIEGWIQGRIEEVGRRAVIVRCPFNKMIRNVKRGRIQASVLEINNDYLGKTNV